MDIFVTGATGYIGGSVASALIEDGHTVHGLVRSKSQAEAISARGLTPVLGTLDDDAILTDAARRADAVVNAADADHRGAVNALIKGMVGRDKVLIHTSGSSIVGRPSNGERSDDIFDETTPFEPSAARADRVALNDAVLAAANQRVTAAIVCPSLIYGLGHGIGQHSMQIPWLIETARKHGRARHLGPGENIWSTVHISDLVNLYCWAVTDAEPGAFYFAENGEHSMRALCQAISHMMGWGGETEAMTPDEAAVEWGAGPAANTMGSNSRVRAVRAREELGWAPSGPTAIEEIETGCYAQP